MVLDKQVWKWYERHDNAVNAVLDIAAGMIPGGALVFQALKAVHACWKDSEENANDERVGHVQDFLVSVKPVMQDFVEELELVREFREATSDQQRKEATEERLSGELKEVLSKIGPSIAKSSSRLSSRGPAKEVLNEKYEIVSLLGSGGQGSVHCARDLEANKLVAVKLLPSILGSDPMAVESLRKEYNRVVDQLVHANIVQYRNMAQDGRSKRWFLVMDYVEGKNMRQWMLERKKAMEFEKAVDFLLPIACALDFAHENKVVHCDLKPENILIRKSDGKLMLTDFGLAREIRASLSKRSAQGDISGTLPYMAPEQYMGRNPDARTDIWALGVILYELVSGFHPFQGTSFEHYMKLICELEPEKVEHLREEEWAILEAMLWKDRGKRPGVAVGALSVREGRGEKEKATPREDLQKKSALQSFVGSLFKEKESKEMEEARRLAGERRREEEEARKLEEQRKKEEETYEKEREEAKRLEEARKKKEEEARRLEEARKKKEEEARRLEEVRKQRDSLNQKPKGLSIPGFTFVKEASYACGPYGNTVQEFRHDRTGMEFVYIPGGTFQMAPNYKVTLSPYLIAKYPCTQAEWQKIMGSNPSGFKGDRRPVERVSWDDCQAFCQKAGLALPTEAQWEFACRAGSSGQYCYGDGESQLGEYAWYEGNSGNQTYSVGEKKPNAFGLYDVHGNVWEWCQDWYGDYEGKDAVDPKGAPNGSYRVHRGGGWGSLASRVRCADRSGISPVFRYLFLGFRCALAPQKK